MSKSPGRGEKERNSDANRNDTYNVNTKEDRGDRRRVSWFVFHAENDGWILSRWHSGLYEDGKGNKGSSKGTIMDHCQSDSWHEDKSCDSVPVTIRGNLNCKAPIEFVHVAATSENCSFELFSVGCDTRANDPAKTNTPVALQPEPNVRKAGNSNDASKASRKG